MIDNEDNKPVRGCPVDAHVHFHRAELVPLTLDAAAENFGRVTPPKKGLLGALLLTQASGERVFEQIKVNGLIGDWQTEPVPSGTGIIGRPTWGRKDCDRLRPPGSC